MELLQIRPLFLEHKSNVPKVSDREIDQYEIYFELLQKWNEEMALVSKTKIASSFAIHFVDSMWIGDLFLPFCPGAIFDIGSGAGFPGLVFAIRNPEKEITLFEKSGKKRKFLEEVIKTLSLKNVAVKEIVPQQKVKGSFFARAVRPPEELVRWLRTVLQSKSYLAVNYGGTSETLRKVSGFESKLITQYELPKGEGFRQFQVLQRV